MILNDDELLLIEDLKNKFIIDNPPVISQDRFDLIVEYLIIEDKREILWRLCGSYDEYEMNFNKVVDYYVLKKDHFYISELVDFVDNVDHEYVANKMIETQDKDFIKLSLSAFGNSMEHRMNPHCLEKLLDYIK